MIALAEWFGLLGVGGIGVMLVVLGLLSKRLGAATKAARRYYGFYAAAGFLFASAGVQALNLLLRLAPESALLDAPAWLLVYIGLPAVGVTIGLVYAWHYWSWLLAESG
jgi:hypothetical protein